MIDAGRAFALFGVGVGLVIAWVVVPPAVMLAGVLGWQVDPLYANLGACGVLVALGVLVEWSD